ncbi:unnamed protein product [Durusdinium trenchii]|uniref:Uncharacterized protein n=1 Tax=Durusdinium trenchii TaxID=1381693 RepID=A0ABP0LF10_9DINO
MLAALRVKRVSDILQMEGAPEPHHVVQEKGLLHAWQPGMFSIFLSHQWLGRAHPDATGVQFCVLQEMLRGIINGSVKVEPDLVSQMQSKASRDVSMDAKTREQVVNGYVFFDWFAIPQITARTKGQNEDSDRSDAAKAVQSIPFYVEVSNLFVALVPEAQHESGASCNYTSWLSRGWCRAELWCHLLSHKPDTSVILAHSCVEVRLMFPLDWQENSIVDGDFTVPEDRDVVAKLGERAVKNKIHHLSTAGPLWLYRFYKACEGKLLGHASSWNVPSFLDNFRYESLDSCVKDVHCMNAMLCAVLAGDSGIIRALANHRADVNFRVKDLAQLGYFDGQTLLMVAAKTRQKPELLATLIELRADIHAVAPSGAGLAHFLRTPEQVNFLLTARGDVNKTTGPIFLSPVAAAAAMGRIGTLKAMLAAKGDVNPPTRGLGHTPLHHAVFFARGNPDAVQIAKLLIEHRADVNAETRPSGSIRWITLAAQAYMSCMGESSPLSYKAFAMMPGATPLLEVAWTGDMELTRLLLEAEADLNSNDFGYSPEDVAKMNGHFHLLPLLSLFSV